jgi:hypothetical protein
LETWGVLGASRTDGEPAVGHGFMVAGQSDRDVPIPGRSWGIPDRRVGEAVQRFGDCWGNS